MLNAVINAAWHRTHRMPMPSTLDQRVEWHLAHAKACGCRTSLPPTIVAELKRRGLKAPAPTKRIAKKR
jgi:hypothetical protein